MNERRASSYDDVPYAASYRAHWPSSRHLSMAAEPEEAWIELHGAEIHLDRYVRPDAAVTVVLLHGGGGHGRLLAPFAVPLHAAGVEVVAPDLPPYGLSRAGPEPVTFDAWVRIVSALVDREATRGRKVVLYGLSLGGVTAYHVAAENPRVAGVVATTLIDVREQEVRDATARNRFVSRVLHPIAVRMGGTLDRFAMRATSVAKMQAMTPDQAVVRRLVRDPHIGRVKVPFGFLRTLTERDPMREPEQFDGPPLLLVHPAADTWTPLPLSEAFFERIAGPKQLVALQGAAHLPLQQPAFDTMQDAIVAFIEGLSRTRSAVPAADQIDGGPANSALRRMKNAGSSLAPPSGSPTPSAMRSSSST